MQSSDYRLGRVGNGVGHKNQNQLKVNEGAKSKVDRIENVVLTKPGKSFSGSLGKMYKLIIHQIFSEHLVFASPRTRCWRENRAKQIWFFPFWRLQSKEGGRLIK